MQCLWVRDLTKTEVGERGFGDISSKSLPLKILVVQEEWFI